MHRGDLGRDVHPVTDQRHAGARVREEGGERRRPAALDAAHRVEGVGHEARPGVDRRAARLRVGVGVAGRDDDPAPRDPPHGLEAAGALGGEGHDGRREGVEQAVDRLGGGVAERRDRVGPRPLRGQEGPLEVDAEDPRR